MANKLRSMKLFDAVEYLKSLGYRCEDRCFGEFEALHESRQNLKVRYDRAMYICGVSASW